MSFLQHVLYKLKFIWNARDAVLSIVDNTEEEDACVYAMQQLKIERQIIGNVVPRENDRKDVPAIIWSYWNNDERLPELIQCCTNSWKKHLPDFEIRILNPNTLSLWLPHILRADGINPANYSDWVRLSVLSIYGGVWLDASIFINDGSAIREPFAKIRDEEKDIFGPCNRAHTSIQKYPVVEYFFLVARQQTAFINEWLFEYEHALSIGLHEYRRRALENAHIIDTQIFPRLTAYHAAFAAQQITMQLQSRAFEEYGFSEDSLHYTCTQGLIMNSQMRLFLNPSNVRKQKLIKFFSDDRQLIERDNTLMNLLRT